MRQARLGTLDSLRGLAAVVVVIGHYLGNFPVFDKISGNRYAPDIDGGPLEFLIWCLAHPFRLIWEGQGAVVVFFVLSGFVLSLPFYRERPPGFRDFAVRRICRIYLPYMAAITLSACLILVVPRWPVPGLSEGHQGWWAPFAAVDLLDHLVMLGSSWHTHIDPVIWSLVHEMRISLVFPAVMLVLLRIGLVPVLTVALAASVLAGVVVEGDIHPYLRSALWTVHYLVFFVAGAALARYRGGIAARLRHTAPSRVALMVLVGLLLFESRGLVPFGDVVVHYLVGVSALLMIALAIGAPRVSALLERPSLAWLGKVSYSLYLLHVPVLMACTYLFAHAMPMPLTMIPAVLVTLVLCEAFYRGVEAPCIALGHRLSDRRARVVLPMPPITVAPLDRPARGHAASARVLARSELPAKAGPSRVV